MSALVMIRCPFNRTTRSERATCGSRPVVTRGTQQSGLAWLGFLMIAAAMAGISVFV